MKTYRIEDPEISLPHWTILVIEPPRCVSSSTGNTRSFSMWRWVCMCAHFCDVCVEARGQCWLSSSIALHLIFWDRALTEPGAHHLARLAGHWDPGILLFLNFQCWYFRSVPPCPAFCVMLGIQTQVLTLLQQALSHMPYGMSSRYLYISL